MVGFQLCAMADEFNRKLAEDFQEFVKGNLDDVQVKVFLCGEALDSSKNIEDQTETNLRAYLKVGIEKEVKNCVVTLAEHKKLIEAYDQGSEGSTAAPKHSNLTDFELQLAHWADLIVILPSSPGSIAELGMFAVLTKFTPKLLILFNKSYGRGSYIWNGPVRASQPRGSTVFEMDYGNPPQMLEAVVDRVRAKKSIKRSSKLLGE